MQRIDDSWIRNGTISDTSSEEEYVTIPSDVISLTYSEVQQEVAADEESVKTGDSKKIYVYIFVGGISIAAITLICIYEWRKNGLPVNERRYKAALEESGVESGLFITKYESMIHTFIAYDPDESGERNCYAPFIEGAFNVEPGKGQVVNEVMRLEVYDDEYEDDCVVQKKHFVYLPSIKFMGAFNMRMMMSMVSAQYN